MISLFPTLQQSRLCRQARDNSVDQLCGQAHQTVAPARASAESVSIGRSCGQARRTVAPARASAESVHVDRTCGQARRTLAVDSLDRRQARRAVGACADWCIDGSIGRAGKHVEQSALDRRPTSRLVAASVLQASRHIERRRFCRRAQRQFPLIVGKRIKRSALT